MLEAIFLVTALSVDAFVASIAYGTNKITIPFRSVATINFVCTFLLGISLYFGSLVREVMPGDFVGLIGIVILLVLGIYQLFEGFAKSRLEKYFLGRNKVRFKVFDFRFVLEIYLDETKADFDRSSRLNMKEALALAIALSVDGLAAGFASGLGDINYSQILLWSMVFHMIAVWGGLWLGGHLAQKSKIDISWLSGSILIGLALVRLIRI